MRLKALIEGIGEETVPSEWLEKDITQVASDSRRIRPGAVFFALKGPEVNGEDYIPEAVAKGAAVIVTAPGYPDIPDPGVFHWKVAFPGDALAVVAQRFFGHPSRRVKVVGITGTNGKTTITYLCESIAGRAKRSCGVIGTVNYRIGTEMFPCRNTTPGLIDSQEYLAEMALRRTDYCFMEVSSHALHQGRVDAIAFRSAVFTNLTQDHLDYHTTMEDYFRAKKHLFDILVPEGTAVINRDDPYGQRILSLSGKTAVTYGCLSGCDVWAEDIHLDLGGTCLVIKTKDGGEQAIRTSLIGRHNVYNILASAAWAKSEGFDLKLIKNGIEGLQGVPGRLEHISADAGFHVFVDYAHTEDALENVLSNLKTIADRPVLLVFGCGGDRDKEKRPKMGAVADNWCSRIFLTNDNPRGEDAMGIIRQIRSGIRRTPCEEIPDRAEAIRRAIGSAAAGDIVLVAGKGHEDYQIFGKTRQHFDDREEIRKILG